MSLFSAPSFIWYDTSTLEWGKQNFGMQFLFQKREQSFSDESAQGLEKRLEGSPKKVLKLMNVKNSSTVSSAGSSLNLSYQKTKEIHQLKVFWGMGLSESWSAWVEMPFVLRQTLTQLTIEGESVLADSDFSLQDSEGYIGNVSLYSKEKIKESGDYQVALVQQFLLPLAPEKKSNENSYYTLTLGGLLEKRVFPDVHLIFSGRYNHVLASANLLSEEGGADKEEKNSAELSFQGVKNFSHIDIFSGISRKMKAPFSKRYSFSEDFILNQVSLGILVKKLSFFRNQGRTFLTIFKNLGEDFSRKADFEFQIEIMYFFSLL